MIHIQKHLSHMLAGQQTTLAHMSDALLNEVSAANLNERALVQLGRHVLQLISSDLKSGIHTQKAIYTAMQGGLHE